MLLGLSRPTSGTVKVYGRTPAEAIAEGRIAAVMQSGGLLKDLTVARDRRMTAGFFPHARPVDEVLERAGIADIAGRAVGKCSGGQQQRLRFAHGAAARPGADGARRADHGDGRRRAARLLERHPRRRPGRPHRPLRDALPGGGGRVRRPDRPGPPGSVVADGTAAEVKALAAGRMVRATLPGADQVELASLPGVDSAEVRGDTVLLHAKDSDAVARYLLTATRRPGPGDHLAQPRGRVPRPDHRWRRPMTTATLPARTTAGPPGARRVLA